MPAAGIERGGELRAVILPAALNLSKTLNNKFLVSVQEAIDGLLLGFQPQSTAALSWGGYAEIGNVAAWLHGKKIAESEGVINYKRTFVSYSPGRARS